MTTLPFERARTFLTLITIGDSDGSLRKNRTPLGFNLRRAFTLLRRVRPNMSNEQINGQLQKARFAMRNVTEELAKDSQRE